MKAFILSAAVLLLCACSGLNQGSKATTDRYLISEQEIEKTSASNAYELIREKRPEFLWSQGPKTLSRSYGSTRLPSVYLDGIYFGGLAELSRLTVESLKEIRYLNERDAHQKFGLAGC